MPKSTSPYSVSPEEALELQDNCSRREREGGRPEGERMEGVCKHVRIPSGQPWTQLRKSRGSMW